MAVGVTESRKFKCLCRAIVFSGGTIDYTGVLGAYAKKLGFEKRKIANFYGNKILNWHKNRRKIEIIKEL